MLVAALSPPDPGVPLCDVGDEDVGAPTAAAVSSCVWLTALTATDGIDALEVIREEAIGGRADPRTTGILGCCVKTGMREGDDAMVGDPSSEVLIHGVDVSRLKRWVDESDHDTDPQPVPIHQLQLLELTADAVDEPIRPPALWGSYCSSPRVRRLIEPLMLIGREGQGRGQPGQFLGHCSSHGNGWYCICYKTLSYRFQTTFISRESISLPSKVEPSQCLRPAWRVQTTEATYRPIALPTSPHLFLSFAVTCLLAASHLEPCVDELFSVRPVAIENMLSPLLIVRHSLSAADNADWK
jgi:hypothetical protein